MDRRQTQAARLPRPRRVTLVTGTMVHPIIEQFAADLLCGQDVLAALHDNSNLGDLVLLPRVMLDNEGTRFLDDITVEEFRQKLPARVEFVRNAPETIEAIRSLASTRAPLAV